MVSEAQSPVMLKIRNSKVGASEPRSEGMPPGVTSLKQRGDTLNTMGKYAGLNLSYSGMVAKAKKDADAVDFAMHDYLKWVGSPHVHLQAVPEGSRFCCLFEGDQVGWHSDLRRVFPWHHRTPAVHRKLKPHEGQFLNLQFARSVKSPLHVFPCMSVSYQQVHPCPSAVELCSRARKRELGPVASLSYKRLDFTRILVLDYRGGAQHGARGDPPRNIVKLPRIFFHIILVYIYIYIHRHITDTYIHIAHIHTHKYIYTYIHIYMNYTHT